jgi:hypothetical protein
MESEGFLHKKKECSEWKARPGLRQAIKQKKKGTSQNAESRAKMMLWTRELMGRS